MFKGLTILYAEDEEFIRNTVVEVLEFMQINVIAVENGEDAYKEYLNKRPDIIISDIEMPKMNGLEFVSKIRQTDNETPIVVATAYADTSFLLKAIELNLTKYILKPIVLTDLKEALTLCMKNLKSDNHLKYFNENSYYDLKDHKLFVDKNEIKLNFHEISFLELLLKYSNKLVSYEQIESIVWDDYMTSNAIRSLVKNLRSKLPEGAIENISKMGYKIITKE